MQQLDSHALLAAEAFQRVFTVGMCIHSVRSCFQHHKVCHGQHYILIHYRGWQHQPYNMLVPNYSHSAALPAECCTTLHKPSAAHTLGEESNPNKDGLARLTEVLCLGHNSRAPYNSVQHKVQCLRPSCKEPLPPEKSSAAAFSQSPPLDRHGLGAPGGVGMILVVGSS
jgi:hypothetical protein